MLILEVTDGSGKYAGSLVSNAQIVRAKSAAEGEGGAGGGSQQGAPLTGKVIINNAKVGLAASVTIEDAPRDAVLKVEWTLDWQSVGSELTYQVPLKTKGKHLAAIVSDTSGKYSSTIYDDEVIANQNLSGKVAISDTTPITGDTVTANVSGTQSGAQLSYQWKADGVAIQGATKTSYTLTDNEVGKALTCEAIDTSNNFDGSIVGVAHPYASWTKSPDAKVVETVRAADSEIINLTDYWKSGDTRKVKLSAMQESNGFDDSHYSQEVEYVISDPGHFTLANGKKCSYVVIQKNCLQYDGIMNTNRSGTGGWEKMPRRTWLNTTYYNALPSSLKPIFKPFTVYSQSSRTEYSETTDFFTFPSYKEVFGSGTNANSEPMNSQLEYYKNKQHRIKIGPNGDPSGWWTRSLLYSESTRFCTVDSSGNDAGNPFGTVTFPSGISPIGCI